jgi:hypothetical protein
VRSINAVTVITLFTVISEQTSMECSAWTLLVVGESLIAFAALKSVSLLLFRTYNLLTGFVNQKHFANRECRFSGSGEDYKQYFTSKYYF